MLSRGWCFTINNDTYKDLEAVVNLFNTYHYVIFGFERGKKGVPHIQGYCYAPNNTTLKSLSKKISRAHIEKANGTPKDNYDYCSKGGEFYEFGDLPVKGKRTDLDELVQMIKDGATREDIKEAYPKLYLMYRKKIEDEVPSTKRECKFYVKKASVSRQEDIQELHEYFHGMKQVAVVYDKLDNLADYDEDYSTVVFYPEEFKNEHSMFPQGYPLKYKYGYERKSIPATTFIIVTETPKMYPLYKLI